MKVKWRKIENISVILENRKMEEKIKEYMHKRLITALAFIMIVLPMSAGVVTEQRARNVATNFMSSRIPIKSLTLYESPVTKADQDPLIYIFNIGDSGFVIIAGDDNASPVLAYSTESSFSLDGAPPTLTRWLECVQNLVRQSRVQTKSASRYISEWKNLENGVKTKADDESEHVLITAKWGQTSPFYDQTPMINGEHTLTGCVATATSILMRYHRWPQAGHGTIPGYEMVNKDGDHVVVPDHVLGDMYDWDNMPLEYGNRNTTAENEAVARLMSDVGAMVEMRYGLYESGSNFESAVKGLVRYMDYDDNVACLKGSSSTPEEIFNTVKAEIDADRIVMTQGHGNDNPGHAYLIDGYNMKGHFHINWGWNGHDNGFFALGHFKEYNDDLLLYYKIQKSTGERHYPKTLEYVSIGKEQSDSKDVIRVAANFHNNTIINNYIGQIAIGKVDAQGRLEEIVSEVKDMDEEYRYFVLLFDCRVNTEIKIGDGLVPVHKPYGTDEWVNCIHTGNTHRYSIVPLNTTDSLERVTNIRIDPKNRQLKINTLEGAEIFVQTYDTRKKKNTVISLDDPDLSSSFTLQIFYGADEISLYIRK